MIIQKRKFLRIGMGPGFGLAVDAGTAQEAQSIAGRRGAGTAAGRPSYAFSGRWPSSVDPNYKPRRFNKAIELWEDGQPVYLTAYTLSGADDGYDIRNERCLFNRRLADVEHG
jgi:hypothetical protein